MTKHHENNRYWLRRGYRSYPKNRRGRQNNHAFKPQLLTQSKQECSDTFVSSFSSTRFSHVHPSRVGYFRRICRYLEHPQPTICTSNIYNISKYGFSFANSGSHQYLVPRPWFSTRISPSVAVGERGWSSSGFCYGTTRQASEELYLVVLDANAEAGR